VLHFATVFTGHFKAGILSKYEVREIDLIPPPFLENALVIIKNLDLELPQQSR
jgi:hypothetical protein